MPILYKVKNTGSKIIFIASASFCKGQKSVSSYPAMKNKCIVLYGMRKRILIICHRMKFQSELRSGLAAGLGSDCLTGTQITWFVSSPGCHVQLFDVHSAPLD